MLRCLAEADTGQRRPELEESRYAAVAYPMAPEETDDGGACPDEDPRTDCIGTLGEATSVYDALDLIAANVVAEDVLDRLLGELADVRAGDEPPFLSGIHSRRRRALAAVVLGHLSPVDVLTDGFDRDPYLGPAPLKFPGSRFVFFIRAAPPHDEVAYGILELQPVSDPTDARA